MIKTNRGQTALIMIVLTAAALIFLAITLNWGRIAQSKVLTTIGSYEAASLLASFPASYGEMQKQTYLKDKNKLTESTGILSAILMIVIAIIGVILAPAGGFTLFLAILSLVFSIVNLVLQAVVVQPGITRLWNQLQLNQPQTEQFFEQGIMTALEASVTDQVNITDYLDWNTNGIFGNDSAGFPKDVVGRFAVFYTERLKMMNQPISPQVEFYYNQLKELRDGETCAENETDHNAYPSVVPLNSTCANIDSKNGEPNYCINNPQDPTCSAVISGSFQLSDQCTGTQPGGSSYSPYCDPCCQPVTKPNPLNSSQPTQVRPLGCDQSATPLQCYGNNPYNSSPTSTDSPFPLLFDPTFQNYQADRSFLALFGRDQQEGPFSDSVTSQGSAANGLYFPNGIYPFFWLMNDYSPQVDTNLNSASLTTGQTHWCVAGGTVPAVTAPTGFTDLAQLTLPYACVGADCCVNALANTVSATAVPVLTSAGAGTYIDTVGDPTLGANPAADPSFSAGGSPGWVGGDDQMCTSWPYNGSGVDYPADGSCEWTGSGASPVTCDTNGNCTTPTFVAHTSTIDGVDETMHTLSAFLNFSDGLLNSDPGSLNATLQSWEPQAAAWTSGSTCSDGSTCTNGTCADNTQCTGSLATVSNNLSNWATLISTWLAVNYTNANAWCVPAENTLLTGYPVTAEDSYINAHVSETNWGDLQHVVACLDYNAGSVPTPVFTGSSTYNQTAISGAPQAFQGCLTALGAAVCPAVGNPIFTAGSGGACDPQVLGRSLAGPVPAAFNGNCNTSVPGSYAKWVSDSATLATDEAPKFALRAQFLTDIMLRAQSMVNGFNAAAATFNTFLKPCDPSDTSCQNGGPAAQLAYAASQTPATANFPNSVIYGWQDGLPSDSEGGCTDPTTKVRVGCSHIVKVTAYGVGRGEDPLLPWIKTSTKSFFGIPYERIYELTDRDGQVYVGVQRWDEDHSPILFPNGRQLWQFLFHNSAGGATSGICSSNPGGDVTTIGAGITTTCRGLNDNTMGFGLTTATVSGMTAAVLPSTQQISTGDLNALGSAFMLNDGGNGSIDVTAHANNPAQYKNCLCMANFLLSYGMESHACAWYKASLNALGSSGSDDQDYSVSFSGAGSCPQQTDSF